jgi:hypothetical protein
LHRLKEVQDVLCARGRPRGQEPVVGVRERSPPADGDEAGVAVFGEDHGCTPQDGNVTCFRLSTFILYACSTHEKNVNMPDPYLHLWRKVLIWNCHIYI